MQDVINASAFEVLSAVITETNAALIGAKKERRKDGLTVHKRNVKRTVLTDLRTRKPGRTADILHKIRIARNDAAHEKRNISETEAGRLLKNALESTRWFNDTYSIKPYSKPVNPILLIQTPVNRQAESNKRSDAAAAIYIAVMICVIIFIVYAPMRCAG